MTSIWTFSDLHQECPENTWDPQVAAPAHADVVVVAGDVHMPLTSALLWLNERLPGSRIVYVPGNHCFWRRSKEDRYCYQDIVAAGKDIAAGFGIDLLVEGESVEIAGVRFVGGTGWTDFTVRPPFIPFGGAIAEANKRMNDYHRIRYGGNRSKDRLTPRDTIYLHRQTRTRIAETLALPIYAPTVVVTHHAPHPLSLGCSVEQFDLPWAYCSDMTSLLMSWNPDLCIHGHLHGRADYMVGDTRVVMNARGHACEPSVKVFDPAMVIEVEKLTPVPSFA